MTIVALIGLPGSGKSTISRQLARQLHCPVLDTDAVMEEYLGCSIAQYFEREGEAAFRDLEAQTLSETVALAQGPVVLATGGGIVLRPENRILLQEQTYAVYLYAAPEQLFARLKHDRSRPLLQNTDMQERLEALYAQRHPLYQAVAKQTVDSTQFTPHVVADWIAQQVRSNLAKT